LHLRIVDGADEDVVVFVLYETASHGELIRFLERGRKGRLEAHFFGQSAMRCFKGGFTGVRMAAARVGPEAAGVVFVSVSSL
jgi:hypothetical protein